LELKRGKAMIYTVYEQNGSTTQTTNRKEAQRLFCKIHAEGGKAMLVRR